MDAEAWFSIMAVALPNNKLKFLKDAKVQLWA